MVDIAVKRGAAWVCHAQGKPLADILRPVHGSDSEAEFGSSEEDQTEWAEAALLEQTEEGSPCVLTLHCSPGSSAAIGRLLVVSEARTMEVYDHTGEYCGTVRGERDGHVQPDGSDRGPFYRKQLCLEHPSSACEVKLLSLAGRSSVLLCSITVGLQQLQQLQHCPLPGPAIDMQQVQCLVEEMGANLSPGAQHLMDMVHFQQKNQTGSLGGFLPLLMGSGAFSALTKGASLPPASISRQPPPADAKPPLDSIGAADEAPPPQNGAMTPDLSISDTGNTGKESAGPVSHGQLAEMMSLFLKGRGHDQVGDDILPVLQSVCGQVTKLRLDDAAAVAEKEQEMRNGSWELDAAMERRLEEMEKRLKEHVDRRLDALEQKLEKALLNVLPQIAMSQGGVGSSAGEAAAAATQQTPALAPAMH